MNFNKIFLFLTIILITVIILTTIASSEQPKSQWLNENPCMIKVIITEKEICKDSKCLIKETQTKKEEVMVCNDGYDGPNYWELFAQFYYNGISVPPYCRLYARPDHPFKTPGMICLSEDGVWEVQ
jgi:hypothetical protein|tara:strand:+ start:114 stop:491 length:378 start_codon:yes stop_codon:yes gene_type:complete